MEGFKLVGVQHCCAPTINHYENRNQQSPLYLSHCNLELCLCISLTIQAGEQVAIVGQNGAGKTTLVRHFMWFLQPTVGLVLIGDLDTKKYSVAKLASRVGYVFQNH